MNFNPEPPPDGDFARYIEELGAHAAAAAQAKQSGATPVPGAGPLASPPTDTARRPAAPSLWSVGRWLLLGWVLLQIAVALLQGRGASAIALLALAVWLLLRYRKKFWSGVQGRLRQMAQQAGNEYNQRK